MRETYNAEGEKIHLSAIADVEEHRAIWREIASNQLEYFKDFYNLSLMDKITMVIEFVDNLNSSLDRTILEVYPLIRIILLEMKKYHNDALLETTEAYKSGDYDYNKMNRLLSESIYNSDQLDITTLRKGELRQGTLDNLGI